MQDLFQTGMLIVKKGRPNAPVARVLESNGDELLIEYVDNNERLNTYGINPYGEIRYIKPSFPKYRKVIFNDPYTIVIWDDGSKTQVKCMEGDKYDKVSGLALCLVKKLYGTTNILKAVVDSEEKSQKEKQKALEAKEEAKKRDAENIAKKQAAKEKAQADQDKINDMIFDMFKTYVSKNNDDNE